MSDRDSKNSEKDGKLKNHEDADPTAKTAKKAQNDAKERLGFGLRSIYRSVLDEPIPDDMMSLLDALDEKDGQEENNEDGNGGEASA